MYIAVDTLGHLLALFVTSANEQDRAQVAFVDQGFTEEHPAEAAAAHGIRLEVVKGANHPAGLRAAAASLSGGTQLRLEGTVSASGTRL